jgi:alkanesulfonate monooxygenase SsuD/methylene tetrahydromethanopterin reductase-like flavin-dependent oxidoreductase (luciferase family)
MMGTHVAARTRDLRIGTGVSLTPFYHPLRLAEEVAMLDVLSDGRVNWGAGRGFQKLEFEAFGVPPEESYAIFREHLQVVLDAWTNERISFKGKYVQFEDIEVLPKPKQKPHPPVWLAASSAEAVTWAGQSGFTIMLDPHSTHEQIAKKRELYREALEEHGHSIAGRQIPMARLLAVAETEREAEEIARQGARWTVGSYVKPGVAVDAGSELNRRRKDLFIMGEATDPVDRYMNGIILYGTPASLIDEIERLREDMFLDYLLCAPLSHSSFALFTEKVLPHFL